MIYVGEVLRDKGWNIGTARDGGSVRIFPYKADVPVQGAEAHEFFQVLDIELDFGIQAGVPVRCVVRVVDGQAVIQFTEDALDVSVVRLYQRCIQLFGVLMQAEVDFLEGTLAYGIRKAFIADERCRKHFGVFRAGFQGILSVQVRGDADGGAIEINADKRKGFAGIEVTYGPAHTRSLSGGKNHRSHQHEGEPYLFKHSSKLRQFSQLYKRERMNSTHLAGKTRTRKPTSL